MTSSEMEIATQELDGMRTENHSCGQLCSGKFGTGGNARKSFSPPLPFPPLHSLPVSSSLAPRSMPLKSS